MARLAQRLVIVRIPEDIVVAVVVFDVVHYIRLSATLRADRMLSQEHPTIAPPAFVVVELEVLRMGSSIGDLLELLVCITVALSTPRQIGTGRHSAWMAGLMWQQSLP